MSTWRRTVGLTIVLLCILAAPPGAVSFLESAVVDEARLAGRTAASFPMADENYFKDMDSGIELTLDEIKGRNMWLVWSGGNDRFWDSFTVPTLGAFDLLKIVSSHPRQDFGRDNRWAKLGLVNEPCFEKAAAPDPKRFGLWLDIRDPSCQPDPFDNPTKYPGVAVGARGKNLPVGSFYGEPTGIVGLRLFPNPAFDEAAARQWDPERYYNDRTYYENKNLVRPYRVGMACGFCHVGPGPTRPPRNAEHPAWSDLSSTVGAQFMRVSRLFLPNLDSKSFLVQLLQSYRPGALDTSLISSDSINNPRTMNALYHFGARMAVAPRLGRETLDGDQRDNKQFNDFVASGPLTEFFKAPDTVFTPHILKDGADSVGPLGALNRVYLNIGLFSEEWLRHFNPLIGGTPITPIRIATARQNSSYWEATETNTPYFAHFLLKAGQPDLLKDAPGGAQIVAAEAAAAQRGRTVFATACARCHSSKGPSPPPGFNAGLTCNGKDHRACFKNYWAWTKTDDYKRQMAEIVQRADFTDGNYLSSDARIPVTLLRTNACSPLAANALAGNIWDNFSSQSYKSLPSVGAITVRDPFTGERKRFDMPAGGRGYTRAPSLVSLWSTAPFLLNNALGPLNGDPSVEARLKAYDAAMEQLLWPEKRDKDALLGNKGVGLIDRTSEPTLITIPSSHIPGPFAGWHEWAYQWAHRWLPWLVSSGGDITIGPIPKNLPVNLLANIRLLPENIVGLPDHIARVIALRPDLERGIDLRRENATDEELFQHYTQLAPRLLALSACQDFEVNRGHYFGTAQFNETEGLTDDEKAFGPEAPLSDDDKRALIAFLKTL
ncbi:hypothetical protein [Bradyrhizobium sp. LHD-71]|uniref:hypothetical protein n=1 Tax=Bradyrhizobium sp. LHD-71 TaxID=3072141 RepID=UPI00280E2BC5|nr:hypothetical protein [Bradyrhizobium sp. LHD-71]MDQ8726119.1 hypothetical protein [Bradyrhizobium sp. LHD-71]